MDKHGLYSSGSSKFSDTDFPFSPAKEKKDEKFGSHFMFDFLHRALVFKR